MFAVEAHMSSGPTSSLEVKCHFPVQQKRLFNPTTKATELTQEARLVGCHISTLADNLEPPCVTAAFTHASRDQNTGQLLDATLNQVKRHTQAHTHVQK